MRSILLLSGLLLAATAIAQEFTPLGEQQGVSIAYRWNHSKKGPSELLLKVHNPGDTARTVHAVLDLQLDGFTNEMFTADLCVPPGRALRGKFNGVYFVPQEVTTEQIRSGATRIELSTYTTTAVPSCP